MFRRYRYRKKILGFTLLELLISLTLSLFILTPVVTILLFHTQRVSATTQLLNLQDSARFIIYQLRSLIETAGYIGCQSLNNSVTIISHNISTQDQITLNNRLAILTANQKPSFINETIMPGSNIIILHRIDPQTANLLANIDNLDQSQILVDNYINFKVNNLIAIADCTHIELFAINNLSTLKNNTEQRLTLSDNINNLYNINNTDVGRLETIAFYLASDHTLYLLKILNGIGSKTESQPLATQVTQFNASFSSNINNKLLKINFLLVDQYNHKLNNNLMIALREF